MARYSGIYLHLEGTTAEINSLQEERELVYDTTSGLMRYRKEDGTYQYLTTDTTNLTGYLLLAGRSGGQTAYGGTGANENLYLRPTSNATKGSVYIADTSGDVCIGSNPSLQFSSATPGQIMFNGTAYNQSVRGINYQLTNQSWDDSYTMHANYVMKTSGNTTYDCPVYLFWNKFLYNQPSGQIGDTYGIYQTMQQSAGNIGNSSNIKNLASLWLTNTLSSGTINGSVYGIKIYNAQSAPHIITANSYGIYVKADMDGTVSGAAYGLYIDCDTDIDWGAYNEGNEYIGALLRAPNIGASTDNSVLILDSSGYFRTDEIDPRVWGTTLADSSDLFWEEIGGSSGILYSGSVGSFMYLGNPAATCIFMQTNPTFYYAGLHTRYGMTLCGTSLSYYVSNTVKSFDAGSGLFNIYDGSLNFQKGANVTPAWRFSSNGTDDLLISGYSAVPGDFTLKSYFGINLLNYSGDTNISGVAGNTYIKQNGNGSTTGNIIISGAGDVYSTPWQSYSITDASGWASVSFSSVNYKTIGDLVFLSYYVTGTANSDQVAEIDLPYSPNSYLDTCHVASVADSGVYGFGRAQVITGTNRLSVSNDESTGPTWETGGVKLIQGQFWYQKA